MIKNIVLVKFKVIKKIQSLSKSLLWPKLKVSKKIQKRSKSLLWYALVKIQSDHKVLTMIKKWSKYVLWSALVWLCLAFFSLQHPKQSKIAAFACFGLLWSAFAYFLAFACFGLLWLLWQFSNSDSFRSGFEIVHIFHEIS